MRAEPDGLVERLQSGDRGALARAISIVEDGGPKAPAVLRELLRAARRHPVTGITGPPGAGKSTLVRALVRHHRQHGASVGALCVDPSSVRSDGALLGDRVRMTEYYDDDQVYIRSMATRGALGGLARSAWAALALMDLAGLDELLVETVGVGQSEVAVRAVADTVVLVLMPGSGDAVQFLKAGVMEIPDVIVVNKSDLPGAERYAAELRAVSAVGRRPGTPRPKIVLTDACAEQGIGALIAAVTEHREALHRLRDGEAPTDDRRVEMVLHLALDALRERLAGRLAANHPAGLAEAVSARRVDPVSAAHLLIEDLFHASDIHLDAVT